MINNLDVSMTRRVNCQKHYCMILNFLQLIQKSDSIVLRKQGNLENALKNFTLVLKCDSHALQRNQLEINHHYNYIGGVLMNQNRYVEALENFNCVLKIKPLCLPPSHSSLAKIYNNIDSVHYSMKFYQFYFL